MKPLRLLCAIACLLPAACATPRGGGRAGIVLFDPDQHVSGAEPLFGTDENRCFKDPTFGLSFVMPAQDISGYPATCQKITSSIRSALGATQGSTARIEYTAVQRNEVIESFVSSSNYICGDHMKFLQQYDGNVNSIFGIASQASAGVAAIVTGGAAQVAAALAALLGGARGTLTNAHFNNQTVGMLASAFQNERHNVMAEIVAGEKDSLPNYTLSRGVSDVLRYHSDCSIVIGLQSAQRAVDQQQTPDLALMKTFLSKLEEVRQEAAKLAKPSSSDLTNNIANALDDDSADEGNKVTDADQNQML